VVLVGPSHRAAFDGCAVFARGAWETPLGLVPVDAPLAEALIASGDGVAEAPRPHAQEHSLEMQLPFLQHLVPGLRLVPVLMGSQSRAECEALALALVSVLERASPEAGVGVGAAGGRAVLLVASSDLSHYHPSSVAARLDAQVAGDVERLDADGLMTRLEARHEHACGGGPIVSVMKAARALGASRAKVLRYADSGDEGEHDKSRVVGYLAAALCAAA
jgi:AmmeMemoRadiSam system protein B